MKRRLIILGGAAVALAATWASVNAGSGPANIGLSLQSGAELAADDSTLLVDVRRPDEWADTGVVAGALLLTYEDAESFLAAIRPHLQEGQSVSLICRSGGRSSRAARQLAAADPSLQFIDIAGGMMRLIDEGYQTVPPSEG